MYHVDQSMALNWVEVGKVPQRVWQSARFWFLSLEGLSVFSMSFHVPLKRYWNVTLRSSSVFAGLRSRQNSSRFPYSPS